LEHVEHLLAEYHDHELPARRQRQVEAHLEICPDCQSALSQLTGLSGVLAEYTLPDTMARAETFRAQVMLRLSRRKESQAGYLSWGWHLIPVGLICVLMGALGLLALSDVWRAFAGLLQWVGIDVWAAVSLPGGLDSGVPFFRALVLFVTRYGGPTLRMCLYLVTLFVFASYVGWVGVLWRARTRPSPGRES
jgi:predicted anti-sigma-YlaC factor YlaD